MSYGKNIAPGAFGAARSGFDGVLLSRYKEVNNCKRDIRSQFAEIRKEAKDAKKHEIIYSVDTRCSVNFSTIKRDIKNIVSAVHEAKRMTNDRYCHITTNGGRVEPITVINWAIHTLCYTKDTAQELLNTFYPEEHKKNALDEILNLATEGYKEVEECLTAKLEQIENEMKGASI